MIGLYNLERNTNIALEKIRMYYQQQGEKVQDYLPLQHSIYEKIYCGSMFTFSNKSYVTDDMICGGSGFDLTTNLPNEIEAMKPKINMGFTTRGCIRKCPFCIVPQKEGNIKITGDIYDFWDGKSSEIIILDNNILAIPEHFEMVCNQILKENLKVDFNQGLDIRLVHNGIAETLSRLKYSKQLRFSWDDVKEEKKIFKGIGEVIKYIAPWELMFYVLIGFDSTHEENYYRVMKLKEMGIDSFVMPYDKHDEYQRDFARWVNHKAIFKSVDWKDYGKRMPV